MKKRILEKQVKRLATQYPVLTITGPRQSGKTTLCRKVFPNYTYVNLEDLQTRGIVQEDPKGLLNQNKNGMIIDEIQRIPELTSYLQPIIDENPKSGNWILTGSQQLEISNTINQSLAGRTALLKLLPFSLSEIYTSKNTPPYPNIIYSGFYPRIYDKNLVPTEALSFYTTTYLERDIRSLINIGNLKTFETFLKICVSQIGQLTNYSKMATDCGVDQKTIRSWLSILEASFVIYFLQPHFKNFRKRLVKMPKLYFYDVGLASYLLNINRPEQVAFHPLRGALFENFIISEFIKNQFNQVKDSNLYFFRDHAGNEVDLILDYGNELVSIEIKSSSTITKNASKGLKYYQNLSGEQNLHRFIVYAGKEIIKLSEVEIFGYNHLPQLFDKLNLL